MSNIAIGDMVKNEGLHSNVSSIPPYTSTAMKLWELPNVLPSIFLSSFYFVFLALLGSAIPVHSTEFTPDNFKSTIASGIWFIEHFSPYCGHCRQFAPTWEELVKYNDEQTSNGIELAQVNCAVHGGE